MTNSVLAVTTYFRLFQPDDLLAPCITTSSLSTEHMSLEDVISMFEVSRVLSFTAFIRLSCI